MSICNDTTTNDSCSYYYEIYFKFLHSFSMFYSPSPFSDLIFSNAAVRLDPLKYNERSAGIVAGNALLRAARIVSCDAPQSLYDIASDPDFLSYAYKVGAVRHIIAITLFVIVWLR